MSEHTDAGLAGAPGSDPLADPAGPGAVADSAAPDPAAPAETDAAAAAEADPAAAAAALAEAGTLLASEVAWREKASTGLLPGLETYEAAIRNTIGLRGQHRLPRTQALFVASCSSHHRDVSLSF